MLELRTGEIFLKLVDFVIKFLQFHYFVETFLALSLKVVLESFFLLNILFDFCLLGKDFIRELKTFSFSSFSLWITILHIVDDQAAVFADSEELVVIKTQFHSVDCLRVSLYLINQVHFKLVFTWVLSNLVNFDGSWF